MKADEIQNLIQNVNQRKIWLTDGTNANCRTLPPSESHIDHEDLKTIQKDIQQMVPNFLKSPIPEMQDVTVSRMKRSSDGFAWSPDPDIPPEVIGSVPSWFTGWTLSKAAASFPESFILRPKHSPIEHWENFIFQSKELTDQLIWRPISFRDFQIFVTSKERTGKEERESQWQPEFFEPLGQHGAFDFHNSAYQANYWTNQIVKTELTEICSFMEIKSLFKRSPVEIVLYLEIRPNVGSDDTGYYSDFGECTVDYTIPQGVFADIWPFSGQVRVNAHTPTAFIFNSMKNARYITITQRLEPGESLTVGQTEFRDFDVPETLDSLLAEAQSKYPDQLSFECSGGNIWRYLCGRFRVLDRS